MITSSDSLTTTYRGTKDTICNGIATLLEDGPKDTPNFVTCLNLDIFSVSKLISVRPDKESKSNNASDAFPSNNLRCTLLDLPGEVTKRFLLQDGKTLNRKFFFFTEDKGDEFIVTEEYILL